MKKIRFFLTTLVLVSSFHFASAFSFRTDGISELFNTVEVTYSPVKWNQKFERYTRTIDQNAFSLNYNQARQISYCYPLYVQYGAGLQYTFHTNKDQDDVKYNGTYYSGGFISRSNVVTVNIPMNIMYCFTIPNIDVNLMPYAGLDFSWNVAAVQNYTEWISINGDKTSKTEKTHMLSKDDMGGHPLRRVELGWQAGAKVSYGSLLFGVSYHGPFTNLQVYDDYKLRRSQVNISLGIIF